MKNSTSAIVCCVAIFSLAACSSANGEEVDTTDSMRSAELVKFREGVTTWEAETKISLSKPATQALERDWIKLGKDLNNQKIKPDLARAYLYELRDTQGLDQKNSAVVSLGDVQSLPLRRYTATASFGKDFGFLRCVSTPEGGNITIDGNDQGTTVKDFVLGAGTHTVGIQLPDMKCVETVRIEKNASAKLACPSISTK